MLDGHARQGLVDEARRRAADAMENALGIAEDQSTEFGG